MSRGSSATSQKSVQDAKKRLQKFLRAQETIPTDILREEAPKLYADVISEIPYKTGRLESSVKVAVAKDKKRPGINVSASARAKNGYNYAGIQHENAEFEHPKPGAKAHFISDPLNRAIKRIIRRIEKSLKSSLKR